MNQSNRKSEYISVREAAIRMGTSEAMMYKLVRNNEIPGSLKLGDKWLIDKIIFGIWNHMGGEWRPEYLSVIKLCKLISKIDED
ncbi:MAG: hypothetical protein GY853_00835 [PVC group bacterium]|nr:hypothetical protein [PVC group bacterium]